MSHKSKFGALGTFSRGKISPHDEGDLQLGVANDGRGNVRIEFGKPIAWVALPTEQAIEFARIILKNAGAKTVEITL